MQSTEIKLSRCYALAWKSFAKWWIPLCAISGAIFVFELAPRFFVHQDMKQLTQSGKTIVLNILNEVPVREEAYTDFSQQTIHLRNKLLKHGIYVFPAVAFLTIVLLMKANKAVKNQGDRRPIGKLIFISLIHVILSIIKLIAFFLLIIPGAYLYIRLLFVSLLMLEKNYSPSEAIRRSWQMTKGNFWSLFLLIFVNTVIQTISLATIIGFIPTTAFVNTARAAAFQMLLQQKNGAFVS